MSSHEWLFKRNCSMAPRQLGIFYLSLTCVSLAISAYFVAHGAWFVMVFAMIEMSAVGTAFLVYARHATDRERIILDGSWLTVEFIECERSKEYRLDARSTKVRVPATRRELIWLDAPSAKIEIGRYLTDFRRREFARELLFAMRESVRSGSRAEF